MSDTDKVLLDAVKQYLTGLPETDRAAVITELSASLPDTKRDGGITRGRERYQDTNKGFVVEGPERTNFVINR